MLVLDYDKIDCEKTDVKKIKFKIIKVKKKFVFNNDILKVILERFLLFV